MKRKIIIISLILSVLTFFTSCGGEVNTAESELPGTNVTETENQDKTTEKMAVNTESEEITNAENLFFNTGIPGLSEKKLPEKTVSEDQSYSINASGCYLIKEYGDIKIYALQNYYSSEKKLSGILLRSGENYYYFDTWEYCSDLRDVDIQISVCDINNDRVKDILLVIPSEKGETLHIVREDDYTDNSLDVEVCGAMLDSVIKNPLFNKDKKELKIGSAFGKEAVYDFSDREYSGIEPSGSSFRYVLSGDIISVYTDIINKADKHRIGGFYTEIAYIKNNFSIIESSFEFIE